MTDRVPPFSNEAERAIIAACLGNSNAYLSVSDILEPQDFFSDKHGYIFDAIATLATKNDPTDIVFVTQELGKRGQLEAVGGVEYIATLQDDGIAARPITRYAEMVRNAAMFRGMIAAAKKIEQMAYDGGDNPHEIMASSQSLLSMTQRQRKGAGWRTIAQIATERAEAMRERAINPTKTRGISSGLHNLDDFLAGRGFLPGKLYVVGGATGMGKSTFLRVILRNIALAGHHVGLLTLEQDEEEVIEELAYGLAAIDRAEHERLEVGLGREELARFDGALKQLKEIHTFHVDDEAGLTIDDARLRMIRLYQQHKVEVIGADYLHIMRPSKNKKEQTREREVASMAEAIRDTGKELGIATILLSQLNLELMGKDYREQGHEPTLKSFRDSGGIAQVAYCAIGLHRHDYLVEMGMVKAKRYVDRSGYQCDPDANGAKPVLDGLMKAKILKQQRGKKGDAWLRFIGNLSQIEDVQPGDFTH